MQASTSTTTVVLSIVREVLAAPSIGLDDDLTDHGFTSLHIMKTAARVTEQVGVELPLAAYFDVVTVADIAAAVDAQR